MFLINNFISHLTLCFVETFFETGLILKLVRLISILIIRATVIMKDDAAWFDPQQVDSQSLSCLSQGGGPTKVGEPALGPGQ